MNTDFYLCRFLLSFIDNSDLKIEDETTLEDIGLDSIAVAETKNILEQDFNIFMDAKEVLQLRVNDLWKIESGQHLSKYHFNSDLFCLLLLIFK